MSDQFRILLRKLRPILASILESVRARFDSPDNQVREAVETWQSRYLFPLHKPRHEFCLQTTLILFVQAYFVRICEEYGLLPPFPTDELESKTWLVGSMQTALYILHRIDQDTLPGTAHCFNWFAPGEATMLQLYHLLKQHNFKDMAGDILGKVYNEGFIEQRNRSEKGQFYTPPPIVDYMLDTLAIPTFLEINSTRDNDYKKSCGFLNKTVADLSCGSGAFLMAASARKSLILQHLLTTEEIQQEDALEILTSTIAGFDLNPFACYLATINLLIQCLPFLLDEHRLVSRRMPQFHIYCTDALDPHSLKQLDLHLSKFDYLVGNPPYVSANESFANLLYRNQISSSGH